MSTILEIQHVPLSTVKRWERNPKQHNLGALIQSIQRYGFRDAPIYDATLDAIVGGNGRIEALEIMQAQGYDLPAGLTIQNGEWYVPIQVGVNARTVSEAEAFSLDHNNMVMAGGDFTAIDQARAWNANYLDLLKELAAADEMPVSVDGDDLDVLLAYNSAPSTDEWGAALGGLPDGDRAPFQQMTFTVSDEQAEQVKEALQRAKQLGPFVATGNENSNGNALARICEVFLGIS